MLASIWRIIRRWGLIPPHQKGQQDFTQDSLEALVRTAGFGSIQGHLLTGERVNAAFVRAVKREKIKYVDAQRQGYPHNQLEQLESFTRTIGDLHNSYFDAVLHKISDCLYNRWKMLYEETRKLAAAGGANKPCWVDVIEVEKSDMPAFFDA